MKKDIEWLREEIYALYPSSYRAYVLKEPDALLKTEIVDKIIELIDQLEEPTKPVIPKFVADYIELNKGWSGDRQEYIEDDNSGLWFALDGNSYGMPNSVSDWLFNEEKVETFARAWLDGYEVEKEKKYYIYDKSTKGYLGYNADKTRLSWYTSSFPNDVFTEAEIKAIDKRYWVFAEEVTE